MTILDAGRPATVAREDSSMAAGSGACRHEQRVDAVTRGAASNPHAYSVDSRSRTNPYTGLMTILD